MDVPTPELESISAYGLARSTVRGKPLDALELRRTQAYWEATLYLSAGMIYWTLPIVGL